jgi:hypothetical protein
MRLRERKRKTDLINQADLFSVKGGAILLLYHIDHSLMHLFDVIVSQGTLIGSILEPQSNCPLVLRDVGTLVGTDQRYAAALLHILIPYGANQIAKREAACHQQSHVAHNRRVASQRPVLDGALVRSQ